MVVCSMWPLPNPRHFVLRATWSMLAEFLESYSTKDPRDVAQVHWTEHFANYTFALWLWRRVTLRPPTPNGSRRAGKPTTAYDPNCP